MSLLSSTERDIRVLLPTDISSGQAGHIAAHSVLHGHNNSVLWAADYGDDGRAIQAAIDAAAECGRGTVLIGSGTWPIQETVRCASGVDVIAQRGAVLSLKADVDGVRLAPDMTCRGGVISATGLTEFTHAAMTVRGADRYFWRGGLSCIRDVLLLNTLTATTGTGLELLAAPGHIVGLHVQNVNIVHFDCGLRLDAQQTDTEQAFVNCNDFRSVHIQGCRTILDMRAIRANENVGGNVFSHIIHQADEKSEHLIRGSGHVRNNQFVNVSQVDWLNFTPAPDAPCIEFDLNTRNNHINLSMYLRETHVSDTGYGNLVQPIQGFMAPQYT